MKFVFKGIERELDPDTVRRVARNNVPDLTDGRHKYYVDVEGHRYPVKQLFTLATGLDPSEFGPGYAISKLRKLDFLTGEYGLPTAPNASAVGDPKSSNAGEDGGSTISFAVSLQPAQDGYIIASCPQLPGCHSQGKSRGEALKNIQEAIRGYIASMKHRGEEIPMAEWGLVKIRV